MIRMELKEVWFTSDGTAFDSESAANDYELGGLLARYINYHMDFDGDEDQARQVINILLEKYDITPKIGK